MCANIWGLEKSKCCPAFSTAIFWIWGTSWQILHTCLQWVEPCLKCLRTKHLLKGLIVYCQILALKSSVFACFLGTLLPRVVSGGYCNPLTTAENFYLDSRWPRFDNTFVSLSRLIRAAVNSPERNLNKVLLKTSTWSFKQGRPTDGAPQR